MMVGVIVPDPDSPYGMKTEVPSVEGTGSSSPTVAAWDHRAPRLRRHCWRRRQDAGQQSAVPAADIDNRRVGAEIVPGDYGGLRHL